MYKGSCGCGAVEYCSTEQPDDCCYCHCTICRKLSGSTGGAYGSVNRNAFAWTRGEDNLVRYKPTSLTDRYFCRICGSFLLTEHRAEPLNVFVSLGTLDTRIEKSPEYHQFAQSLPDWFSIHDGLPCHAAWPPAEW